MRCTEAASIGCIRPDASACAGSIGTRGPPANATSRKLTPARTLRRDPVLRLTRRHTWACCLLSPAAAGRGHGELPYTNLGSSVHHRRGVCGQQQAAGQHQGGERQSGDAAPVFRQRHCARTGACTVPVLEAPTRQPACTLRAGQALRPCPVFSRRWLVGRQVHITPAAGKKVEHQGIKVELLGTIELFFDRGNTYDFVSMGASQRHWCRAHGWRRAGARERGHTAHANQPSSLTAPPAPPRVCSAGAGNAGRI